MSAKMTGMVFDRYPGSGCELLLALAIADHAHDDGRKVFPFVDSLASKARQSVRTVQRTLAKMVADGWLIRVTAGDGGRGRATEYRISPEWIAGRTPVPALPAVKGANLSPFMEPERVTSDARKGDTAVSPAIEPQEPREYIPPNPPRGAKPVSQEPSEPGPKGPSSISAWLARCEARGEKPIPPDDAVFDYCAKVGIGPDVLALHWREFKARRLDSRKRQADWRKTFRNSVRDNWYRLWFLKPGFDAQLTTMGLQAQAAQRSDPSDLPAAGVAP
jgi:hypothetical protein